LLQQPASDGHALKRKDGKKDHWAPAYLLEPLPLDDCFSYGSNPRVKIADLGAGGFYDANISNRVVQLTGDTQHS